MTSWRSVAFKLSDPLHHPVGLLLGPPRSGKTTEIQALNKIQGFRTIDLRSLVQRRLDEAFTAPRILPQVLDVDSLDEFAVDDPMAELRHLLQPWMECGVSILIACRAAEVLSVR